MKKSSLTRALFVAGVVAAAGVAQADAIFYPDGTHVELGNTDLSALASSDEVMVSDSGTVDTQTLGAGPATTSGTSTTTVTTQQYVYVQPNINWDRSGVMAQIHSNGHLMHGHMMGDRTAAAATFNVPARAGEASTMTGGAPNALTSNDRVIVGSYVIPYNTVTTSPYYVFSY